MIAASRGIVFVPIGLALFSRILGIDGVWVSLPFAEVVTVGVCFWIEWQKRKQRGLAEMMEKKMHTIYYMEDDGDISASVTEYLSRRGFLVRCFFHRSRHEAGTVKIPPGFAYSGLEYAGRSRG